MTSTGKHHHRDPPGDWVNDVGEQPRLSFGNFFGWLFTPVGLILEKLAEWFDW